MNYWNLNHVCPFIILLWSHRVNLREKFSFYILSTEIGSIFKIMLFILFRKSLIFQNNAKKSEKHHKLNLQVEQLQVRLKISLQSKKSQQHFGLSVKNSQFSFKQWNITKYVFWVFSIDFFLVERLFSDKLYVLNLTIKQFLIKYVLY